MSNLREEFEKLSNIKCFINIFEFDEIANEYKYKIGKNIGDHTLGFVNGAWMTFQEQQKKIYKVMEAIKMQEKYHDRQIDCLCDEIKDVLK